MKKDLGIIIGLFGLIVGLIVFGNGFTSASLFQSTNQTPAEKALPNAVNVTVKSLSVQAEVVVKTADRKKGLSKRDSLPLGQGMLFVFENIGPYGFWMKDMRFAIDVIWIDDSKRIIDIASNIPPEPGKSDRELMIYKPKGDARYVLEVNAGLSQLHGLAPGDLVDFTL